MQGFSDIMHLQKKENAFEEEWIMRKRMIVAAVSCVVVGSVLLSACSTPTSQAAMPDVISVQNVESGSGTISVTSTETVKVVPDMAEITYGITTENEDAAACQQDNTEQLNRLLEYLKGEGFEDSSIRTSGFSLDTNYDWSGSTRRIIGYEMRTQVTVTNVPMDQVGAMLTKGVESGANEIDSVSYFASSYDEAYSEALTKAVETAKTKAETLAAAGGRTIFQVSNINEYTDSQYGRYVNSNIYRSKTSGASGETMAAASMDMGVMPGEMEVTATVSVEFEIR